MSSVESLFSPTSLFMSGMASQLQAKAMKKLDTDADGSVTQTEFQAVLEKAAKRFAALAKVEERHANHYRATLEKIAA